MVWDSAGEFTHPQGGTARSIIIFGVQTIFQISNSEKTQNILILGHGLTQKVNNTTVCGKKCFHLILVQKIKNLV